MPLKSRGTLHASLRYSEDMETLAYIRRSRSKLAGLGLFGNLQPSLTSPRLAVQEVLAAQAGLAWLNTVFLEPCMVNTVLGLLCSGV